MNESVFVYGALRSGAAHHWRMQGAHLLGAASVEGILLKIDWYPGLILGASSTKVLGEVYEVRPELLKELDQFEGLEPGSDRGGEYARVRAKVLLKHPLEDATEVEVWLYEWQKGQEGYEKVASGDWLSVEV